MGTEPHAGQAHGQGNTSDQALQVAQRLREKGVNTDRFIHVIDGEKRSSVGHSNPANRHSAKHVDGNYGIYANGDIAGGLVDVDVDDYSEDTNDSALAAVNNLPETLTVKTPHTDGVNGGHRFYKVVSGKEFETAAEACEAVWNTTNPGPSWGEVRVQNQYVVGPGSQLDGCDKDWCEECAMPEEGRYEIAADRSIATITADDLADVLRDSPDRPRGTSPNHTSATTATDVGAEFQYDRNAAAVVRQSILEFRQAEDTTHHSFDYLMDLVQGRYAAQGHTGDHSGAEVDLASKLYGILRFSDDDEDVRNRIYSYIQEATDGRELADDGEARKWVRRGDRYRDHVLNSALQTFDSGLWDRWRFGRGGNRKQNGDYSTVTYRCVLQAVHSAFTERPGYPSKGEIVDVAQGLDPSRSQATHETALQKLRREHAQVKMAYLGSNEYVYYPASEPDPPNAEWAE